MTNPIRAALERLIEALDDYEPVWGGFPESALAAARAALAEQQGNEAQVSLFVDSHIDPEHQCEDRQILHVFYDACMSEGGTANEIHLRGLRAVLSRWGHQPAPPAEGEVAELVAALQADAECVAAEQPDLMQLTDKQLARAAELLQQQEAEIQRLRAQQTPVPVSEGAPGPEDCYGKVNCWWFDPHADGAWYMDTYQSDYTHWLPAHALPLPQGEVE